MCEAKGELSDVRVRAGECVGDTDARTIDTTCQPGVSVHVCPGHRILGEECIHKIILWYLQTNEQIGPVLCVVEPLLPAGIKRFLNLSREPPQGHTRRCDIAEWIKPFV